MTTKYGDSIENLSIISEKSKSKKDGIYSFRGVTYLVQYNRLTYYVSGRGVYQYFGNHVVQVDECIGWASEAKKKALKKLIK